MRGLMLVFSLHGPPAALPADGWFGQDKLQHFFSSAFVQSLAYGSLRASGMGHAASLAGATAATATVGVGKELYDARHKGDPSYRDLVWDAAGAGAMTILLARTAR
jgi:putative lipoprotein